MTHDQLFFLNWAQIWCGSMTPEEALTKIRSSVHSPGPVRVWGPLSNSEDFARAYNCPRGSPMNPTHKCSVWYVSHLRISFPLKFNLFSNVSPLPNRKCFVFMNKKKLLISGCWMRVEILNNYRIADVTNLKINERSNVEWPNLPVTEVGNQNLKNWFMTKGKYESWKNCE